MDDIQITAEHSMISIQAQDYVKHSKSQSTIRAYKSDWKHFSEWCARYNYQAMPASPQTVADYIAFYAEAYKPATLDRKLASISKAHKTAGFNSPTGSSLVRDTLRGIKRRFGTAQNKKAPVRISGIRQIAGDLPDTLQGRRDKALLLVGYICAMRRSELVALNIEDVAFDAEGMKVIIRKSKTDQEGRGAVLGIAYGSYVPTCPVRALKAWIDASGITCGAVFRPIDRHGRMGSGRLSGKAVGLVIKRIAPALGLDPESVGGHSLRAGLITDLYAVGTPEGIIAERSRHKSRSVMDGYRREANLYAYNYTAALGM